MPTTSPRLFPLQGVLRRVVYVALYEGLAIAFVTIAFVAGDQSLGSASGVAVGSSLIAVLWNLLFNALFERWEARQAVRCRGNVAADAVDVTDHDRLVQMMVGGIHGERKA